MATLFEDQSCDVAIVGGGINGAGLARDLALRARCKGVPLRVLLLEKDYWSGGTSGKNSHLIHGGLRYLKYFDFGLVQEALRERALLLKLSPNSVRPLRFEIPLRSLGERLFYSAGVALYDLLSVGHRIGASRYWGGPLSYWDAASDSAALVIDNMRDARHLGARCVARMRVTNLTARSVTLDSGERIEAKVVVDTRGPWADAQQLRLVRGSHIVLPRLYEGEHAVANFHRDGRVIFFIPWGDLNPLTLVGTTDVDHHGPPDEVRISREEVEYLCRITEELFPDKAPSPIIGTFSSLRPLVVAEGKSATATSREHKIGFDEVGVLRISGGKYTTYRSMAEEAADRVCAAIAPALEGFYPTRTEPFVVDTQRPEGVRERLTWARREEGCDTLEAFLTCSTNWAWQKAWTAAELRELGASEEEAKTLAARWKTPEWMGRDWQ